MGMTLPQGQGHAKGHCHFYCQNRRTCGLRHNCNGSSKLPSSGRVTLFNEPSTMTSNAAITQGRSIVRTNMYFFNPNNGPGGS